MIRVHMARLRRDLDTLKYRVQRLSENMAEMRYLFSKHLEEHED